MIISNLQVYVKRNERLYPNGFPGQKGPEGQVWDDPYDLPDTSGSVSCDFSSNICSEFASSVMRETEIWEQREVERITTLSAV